MQCNIYVCYGVEVGDDRTQWSNVSNPAPHGDAGNWGDRWLDMARLFDCRHSGGGDRGLRADSVEKQTVTLSVPVGCTFSRGCASVYPLVSQ